MIERRHPRWLGVLLWVAAVILMLATAVYQRRTGPTYPYRGEVVVGSEAHSYRLLRSQETTGPARIVVPRPGPEASGVLSFRRYPTNDPFEIVEMRLEPRMKRPALIGELPVQPPAGKVEYYLELLTADGMVRIPEAGGEESTIILRYKGPVPAAVLIAHVAFMFFSVLIGMRAGLGALFAPSNIRSLSRLTLGLMTLGGMLLGPFVQKYAFGEYWTGFPWGYDLTDNKTLIMWVVWVLAVLVLGGKAKKIAGVGRAAVLAAALVMTVVYLIPHSLRGSELDFEAVDAGVAAQEAIGTAD